MFAKNHHFLAKKWMQKTIFSSKNKQHKKTAFFLDFLTPWPSRNLSFTEAKRWVAKNELKTLLFFRFIFFESFLIKKSSFLMAWRQPKLPKAAQDSTALAVQPWDQQFHLPRGRATVKARGGGQNMEKIKIVFSCHGSFFDSKMAPGPRRAPGPREPKGPKWPRDPGAPTLNP